MGFLKKSTDEPPEVGPQLGDTKIIHELLGESVLFRLVEYEEWVSENSTYQSWHWKAQRSVDLNDANYEEQCYAAIDELQEMAIRRTRTKALSEQLTNSGITL